MSAVLYDVPGPRAKARNRIANVVVSVLVLAAIGWVVYRLNASGQFEARRWAQFQYTSIQRQLLDGLLNTLKAAGLATVFALILGALLAAARISDHKWIRVPATLVIELFRAIPLLILMFFFYYGNLQWQLGIGPFWDVVFGLTLYNGSVLAEIFRAGINAVPRGQSEAAYAIGLRKSGVMRLILIPQATTAMMPAIVSQLVVLLKDSALGWIISYEDLLNTGYRQIPTQYGNLIPAAMVIALLYIAMNLSLSFLATWLEKRSRRSRKTSAKTLGTGPGVVPGAGVSGEVMSI
jgi:glutamate transport system permease protein